MNCLLEDKCWDARSEKCGTCMHNEERSYYVAYHEYPPDKVEGTGDEFHFKWPDKGTGNDLRSPNSCAENREYPSPTSDEWPYLPTVTGNNMDFPLTTAAARDDLRFHDTPQGTAAAWGHVIRHREHV